jgi:hypothetical protein
MRRVRAIAVAGVLSVISVLALALMAAPASAWTVTVNRNVAGCSMQVNFIEGFGGGATEMKRTGGHCYSPPGYVWVETGTGQNPPCGAQYPNTPGCSIISGGWKSFRVGNFRYGRAYVCGLFRCSVVDYIR